MSSNKRSPTPTNNPNPWEEGFTLAETLVAVLIFTLITAGAAVGIRSIAGTVGTIRTENRYLQELLLFEKIFSEQTQRILLPWFAGFNEEAFNLTDTAEIHIPFIDGPGELEIHLFTDDSGLHLQYPGEEETPASLVFNELTISEAELVFLSGRPAGIRLTFTESGENHIVNGLFGALPLYRGNDE